MKKSFIGGGLVQGHIVDAVQKKLKTGKPFKDCLKQSVKETITEDLPGTSHIYNLGKKDGRVQGTAEQAARDEKKMKDMHEKHKRDRKQWQKIDREKGSPNNTKYKNPCDVVIARIFYLNELDAQFYPLFCVFPWESLCGNNIR